MHNVWTRKELYTNKSNQIRGMVSVIGHNVWLTARPIGILPRDIIN